MLWARIENGRVAETFTHPEDPTPLFVPGWTWVEAPEGTRQGATYDGSTFANPVEPGVPEEPAPPEPARRKRLTPAEFRHSFSAFEEVAILDFIAGKVDGEAAALSTARRVVDVFFDRLKDTRLTFVDVSDPRNLAGLDLLVLTGLITAERRVEIAAGVVD